MKKLYILTAPIKTGKTTQLMQWASTKKNIDGIFQPVIDNKRFIYHISSRTLKQLEVEHESDTINIGKYSFSKKTFIWAQNLLEDSLRKKIDWLIIDEIGPLELDGNGLEPIVTKIFNMTDKFDGNILCVVRESIFEKFVKHYNLENRYNIFSFNDYNS